MNINLSLSEIQILLGARLMFWGVPFTMSTKRTLGELEERILDDFRERLLSVKDQILFHEREGLSHKLGVDISVEERELIVEVMEAVLEECRGDDVELHIHVGNREDVVALLEKLRRVVFPGAGA